MLWLKNKSGQFSVKSLSLSLKKIKTIYVPDAAKGVWRGLVPYRIENFVWMAILERLKTKDRLIKIGALDLEKGDCVFRGNCVEEVNHLLLHYVVARCGILILVVGVVGVQGMCVWQLERVVSAVEQYYCVWPPFLKESIDNIFLCNNLDLVD